MLLAIDSGRTIAGRGNVVVERIRRAQDFIGDAEELFDTLRVILEEASRAVILHSTGTGKIVNDDFVPDLPYEQLAGFRATRLGYRHRAEPVVRSTDPRGATIYWVGPAGPGQDNGPGTDFQAIADGYVSVTPLHVDLTAHQDIAEVRDWLGGGT